jgi:hypothetical protein
VSDTHLGPAANFSHPLFDYFFRQFRVCWCGAPSLMRSWVCTFQFLLGIVSAAFLRSESHGTHEYILLSLFLRLPPPGGPGTCIYFPQEQGSPVILLGIGPPINSSQHHITTDNQSASLSWCLAPIWDPRPIFLSPWDFLVDSHCLSCCSTLSEERTGS